MLQGQRQNERSPRSREKHLFLLDTKASTRSENRVPTLLLLLGGQKYHAKLVIK
jgi:hypothetical protein